jgi:hypothetical protein
MPMTYAIRLAVLAALLALPDSAFAASSTRTALEDIQACASIEDAGQRLACYDGKMPKVRAALNQATEEDRVELFGLTLWEDGPSSKDATRPEEFGADRLSAEQQAAIAAQGAPAGQTAAVAADTIDEIASQIVEVGRNNAERLVFVLANGQVWRQSESKELGLPSNPSGMTVRISKGSLGAYFLTREGSNRRTAVVRIR